MFLKVSQDLNAAFRLLRSSVTAKGFGPHYSRMVSPINPLTRRTSGERQAYSARPRSTWWRPAAHRKSSQCGADWMWISSTVPES